MTHERYEIEPRPAAVGGGWNLHLIGKDSETGQEAEIDCAAFPPGDDLDQNDGFLDAVEAGRLWINRRQP